MTTVLLVGQINQIEPYINYIVKEGIKIKFDIYGGFYRKTDFENGLVIIHSCRYDRFNDTDKQMLDIQNISYVFYCDSDTGPDNFRLYIKNLNLYLPNRIPYLRLKCDGTTYNLSIQISHALALNRCISSCSTFSEILSFCSTYHFDRSWVGSLYVPTQQDSSEIKVATQSALEIKPEIQEPLEIKLPSQGTVEMKPEIQETVEINPEIQEPLEIKLASQETVEIIAAAQEPLEIKEVSRQVLEWFKNNTYTIDRYSNGVIDCVSKNKTTSQEPLEINPATQETVEIIPMTQKQEPVEIMPEMQITSCALIDPIPTIPSVSETIFEPFETISEPFIKIEKDQIKNKGFMVRVNNVMKYMDEHAELFKCYVRWESIENLQMRSDFMKVFLLNDIKITEITETGFWIHWDN